MDITLSLLPSRSYSQKRKLPMISAVYIIICEYDIVYIGKSLNLFMRFRAHDKVHNLLELYGDFEIAWIECEADRLVELEKRLVSHFKPPLNQHLKNSIDRTILLSEQKQEVRNAIGLIQEGLMKLIRLI
jgi:excinuclease UvrABC nuclease subunit